MRREVPMWESRWFLVGCAALWLVGVGAADAEEVNLSRLRTTASIAAQDTPAFVVEPLPTAEFASLCEDADGCTARLEAVAGGFGVRCDQRLFFKSGTSWSSSGTSTSYVDADNLVTSVVFFDLGPGNDHCSFTDGDNGGADDLPGFSLFATHSAGPATAGFTCVLTLID